MIMQQEQLAAGVTTKKVTNKAIAAAVEASTLVDLTFASASSAAELPSTEDWTELEHLQDMSTFSPSEEVELASTDENRFWTCFPDTLMQTVPMPKAGM